MHLTYDWEIRRGTKVSTETHIITNSHNDSCVFMPKGDAMVQGHPSAGVGVHITATYAGHRHFHNHILHWTQLDAAWRCIVA